MTDPSSDVFDALLLLSFGGPEGPDEVVPFLENVTRGRGIPRERLREVGEHYFHFGGVSPLNQLNREIIAHLEESLRRRGDDLPVYFGNRNWHPYAEEAAAQMSRDGVRRALVLATSAWGGYSACRQYDEDIQRMKQHLADKGLPDISFLKLRQFYDHPLFIEAQAASIRAAYEELGFADPTSAHPQRTRLIFSAHSVPVAADNAAGGVEEPRLYSRQIAEAARLVAAELGVEDYDIAWQSRSGAAHIPWLEPDVVDHLEVLVGRGELENLVVCPLGFLSDHMEVVWDLDTELAEAAAEAQVGMVRAQTVGSFPQFTELVLELLDEVQSGRTPRRLGTLPAAGQTVDGAPCAEDCCATPRPHHVATASAVVHSGRRGAEGVAENAGVVLGERAR